MFQNFIDDCPRSLELGQVTRQVQLSDALRSGFSVFDVAAIPTNSTLGLGLGVVLQPSIRDIVVGYDLEFFAQIYDEPAETNTESFSLVVVAGTGDFSSGDSIITDDKYSALLPFDSLDYISTTTFRARAYGKFVVPEYADWCVFSFQGSSPDANVCVHGFFKPHIQSEHHFNPLK